MNKNFKIAESGVLAWLFRFLVGGAVLQGIRLGPNQLSFNILLAVASALITYVLFRFVVKPKNIRESFGEAVLWVFIALFLDLLITTRVTGISFIEHVTFPPFWLRIVAMLAVAPFAVRKESTKNEG